MTGDLELEKEYDKFKIMVLEWFNFSDRCRVDARKKITGSAALLNTSDLLSISIHFGKFQHKVYLRNCSMCMLSVILYVVLFHVKSICFVTFGF